jgi:hypothetical protein
VLGCQNSPRGYLKMATRNSNYSGIFRSLSRAFSKSADEAADLEDKVDVPVHGDNWNSEDGHVAGLNMGPSERMSGGGSERMQPHYSNPTRQDGISADYEAMSRRLGDLEKAVTAVAAYLKGQPFPRSESLAYGDEPNEDSDRVGEAGEDDTAGKARLKALAATVKDVLKLVKADEEDGDDGDDEDQEEDVEKALRTIQAKIDRSLSGDAVLNVGTVPNLMRELSRAAAPQRKKEVTLARAPDFNAAALLKGGPDAATRLNDAIDALDGPDHLTATTLRGRMLIGRTNAVAWDAFSAGLAKASPAVQAAFGAAGVQAIAKSARIDVTGV